MILPLYRKKNPRAIREQRMPGSVSQQGTPNTPCRLQTYLVKSLQSASSIARLHALAAPCCCPPLALAVEWPRPQPGALDPACTPSSIALFSQYPRMAKEALAYNTEVGRKRVQYIPRTAHPYQTPGTLSHAGSAPPDAPSAPSSHFPSPSNTSQSAPP